MIPVCALTFDHDFEKEKKIEFTHINSTNFKQTTFCIVNSHIEINTYRKLNNQ